MTSNRPANRIQCPHCGAWVRFRRHYSHDGQGALRKHVRDAHDDAPIPTNSDQASGTTSGTANRSGTDKGRSSPTPMA